MTMERLLLSERSLPMSWSVHRGCNFERVWIPNEVIVNHHDCILKHIIDEYRHELIVPCKMVSNLDYVNESPIMDHEDDLFEWGRSNNRVYHLLGSGMSSIFAISCYHIKIPTRKELDTVPEITIKFLYH